LGKDVFGNKTEIFWNTKSRGTSLTAAVFQDHRAQANSSIIIHCPVFVTSLIVLFGNVASDSLMPALQTHWASLSLFL
jgi:hypothetical protein